MTRAPGDDEGKDRDQETEDDALVDSEAEEVFFHKDQEGADDPPLKFPAATNPKVKPMRVDPTPSEEFFGESLSKIVEEIDKSDE